MAQESGDRAAVQTTLTAAVRSLAALHEHVRPAGTQAPLGELDYQRAIRPGCALDEAGQLDDLLAAEDRARLAALFAARAAALAAQPGWEPAVLQSDLVFKSWDRAVALDGAQPRYRLERGLARLDFDRLRMFDRDGIAAAFAAAKEQDLAPAEPLLADLPADDPLRKTAEYLDAQLQFHQAENTSERTARAQLYLDAAKRLEAAVSDRLPDERAAALVRCGDAFVRSANYLKEADPKLSDETKAEIRERLNMAIDAANRAMTDYERRATPQHAYTLRGNALEDFPWLLREEYGRYADAIRDFETASELVAEDDRQFQRDFASYNLNRCRAKQCMALWNSGTPFEKGSKGTLGEGAIEPLVLAAEALGPLGDAAASAALGQDARNDALTWHLRLLRYLYASDEPQLARRRYEAFQRVAQVWPSALAARPDLLRRLKATVAATQFEYARTLDSQSPEAIELEQQADAAAAALLAEAWESDWERRNDLLWIRADRALRQHKNDAKAALQIWEQELAAARSAGGARWGTLLGGCAEWTYQRGRMFRASDPKRHDDFLAALRRDATAAAANKQLGVGQQWAALGVALLGTLETQDDNAKKASLAAFFQVMDATTANPELLFVATAYTYNYLFRSTLFKPDADPAKRAAQLAPALFPLRNAEPPRLRQLQALAALEELLRTRLK